MFMYKDNTILVLDLTEIIIARYGITLMGVKEEDGLEFLTEDSQNQDQHEAN